MRKQVNMLAVKEDNSVLRCSDVHYSDSFVGNRLTQPTYYFKTVSWPGRSTRTVGPN